MSGATDETARAARVEARLDELERESAARRDELRSIAAALPAATSRRAVVRSMVAGLATAPDKPTVVRRVVRKILRGPADVVRHLRSR